MGGFVLRTNARSSTAFPRPTDDPDEQLRGFFSRMDGDRLFTFLLWELPAARSFENGLGGLEPLEFIQCAGSAEALTVEVRRRDDTDTYVLWTAGRAGEDPGPRDVEIEWRGNINVVHGNERWTSDEAAELFLTYWRSGTLPDDITRRPLERFEN